MQNSQILHEMHVTNMRLLSQSEITKITRCYILYEENQTTWTSTTITLPYLTFEVDATRGSIQHSGHQVGPLRMSTTIIYETNNNTINET